MKRLVTILSVFILSSCASHPVEPVTEIVRVYITATPGVTSTPAATATQTPTPTNTPTPTPTAPPISISGSPRSYQLLDPTPSYGAPCGLVDTFDFPLDPPDGESASMRNAFGNFSGRYGKFHAGEDWGFRSGSNLGKPVYSIGHGQVTYAAPNGWGVDLGTVVIRHVFPWGGYVLSFYGHLDPPSVEIRAGECVQRGDKIGEIGDPSSPPHLHFETRLHLPNSTGHGYWSVDPALAGWLPPSQTIWETRMAASPGVIWTRPYAEGFSIDLGGLAEDYVLIHGGELVALSPQEGAIQWSQTISETVRNAVLDRVNPLVYLLDFRGDLAAYPLPGASRTAWVSNLRANFSAELLPLPGGGVLVADRNRAIAVNPEGQVLWEVETLAEPTSWTYYDDTLVFTTSSSETPLWTANVGGAEAWNLKFGGKLAGGATGVYLYAQDGVYRLDLDDQTARLVLALPNPVLSLAEMVVLKDGNLLLIHADRHDRRLLLIDPEGSLIWEGSIRELAPGGWRLVLDEGDVYLMVSGSDTSGLKVDIYAIDLETGSLVHILAGGSRQPYTRNTWLSPMGEGLFLLNIGEGPLLGFDPKTALGIISPP